MCTVLVGYNLFQHEPLVVAANRDEMLDRAARPPQIFEGARRVLAPTDLVRGGTWIGVNASGVFAALTNRIDVTSVWDPNRPDLMKSRGEIVHLALANRTASDALAVIARLRTRDYNGYHLIVGDAEDLFTAAGGGASGPEHPVIAHHSEEPGLLVVSNLGIGPAHSPRARAIMDVWGDETLRLRHEKPHRALWDRLLTIHDPDPHHENGWMKRMASTCIHRPEEENYGTRSSTFLALNASRGAPPHRKYPAEWRYWHRERPAGAHACHGRWSPVITLPIQE
ncbi:MAG: NRDE family protein [Patescibacteria group bacterium]|jgi:uncharacterized protein with NRDE domain